LNFEQLLKTFILNYNLITDKKRAFQSIADQLSLLKIKKEKLKLGKVSFEIKYTYFNGIVLHQELEMVHCRQDNTDTDALKLATLIDYYS
jgi:hypothetical protein